MPEGDATDAELIPGPSPLDAALKGLCPRCGAKTLFAGFARFADRCRACDLDFTQFNVGDGPAAFLTLIIGTIVVGLAVVFQVKANPPLWLQMLVWIPVTAVLVDGSLRFAKGMLMSLEFRNAAREGRISDAKP